MKLTEEQKLKLSQNIKGKGLCPNCNFDGGIEPINAKFQLMSHMIHDGIIDQNAPVQVWPVVALKCPQCGFISLFDAKFFGFDETDNF